MKKMKAVLALGDCFAECEHGVEKIFTEHPEKIKLWDTWRVCLLVTDRISYALL